MRPKGGIEGYAVMSFEIKSCQLLHFGPHTAIPGRVTGVVRVRISEEFLATRTEYTLDLKVKADIGAASSETVRHALLAHAARQLNKLKTRHQQRVTVAAE
ncbi:hypothetical protein [Devosia soli]|nr:hypothetical protein [Devosia soli]